MDITEKRSIKVGLFVVLGVIIFLAGILTIGSMKKMFGSTISIKTIFADVNGLKPGNNIWYSGVKIGTVKTLRFLPNSDVEVLLSIEDKSKEFIRKNAKAKVSTDGLIGNKIIVIYGGTQKVESIEDGDELMVEKIESTDEMIAVLSENNKNLLGITAAFKTISKNILEGKGTVGMLLNDERLYNDLDKTLGALRHAASNTQTLTSSLGTFTAQLNKKGTLANDIVTDTIIMNDVRTTLAKLDQTVNSANQVVDNLKKTSEDLNNNTKSPAGVLLHDEETAVKLKNMIQNLETSTSKLDENMIALRSSFPFKKYFKKKAKEQDKAKADSTSKSQ